MSTSNSVNGTTIVTGPDVIQRSDFYVHAGILHPLIVGSIAVIVLFFYLRLGSNRCVAPLTIFDWIINVALGSTLAGIVNGNSLTRGLIALYTMLAFQYITSHLSSHYKHRFEWIFYAPPLVVAFRGEFLHKVMRKHRISESDIYSAMRQQRLLHIEQIEAVIVEANGTLSIFTQACLQECKWEPMSLTTVPAYKALCEQAGTLEPKKLGSEASVTQDIESVKNAQRTRSLDGIAVRNERPQGTGANMHSFIPV